MYQLIKFQRGAGLAQTVLSSALSYCCLNPHHCPSLKGQSLGRPHPSPSPQSPGTVTHPLQRCFQLQKKKNAGVSQNKSTLQKAQW